MSSRKGALATGKFSHLQASFSVESPPAPPCLPLSRDCAQRSLSGEGSVKRSASWRLGIGLTMVGLLLACGQKQEPVAPAKKAEEATGAAAKADEKPAPATPKVSDKPREIAVTPEKAAAGSKLFGERCATCHGKDGEGRTGIGPRLNSESFLAAATDDYLVRTISKGRAGTTMIAWGAAMQKGEIESVIAHMRSWKKVEPAKLDESPVKGDSAKGAKIFNDICSGCHGRTGGGYMETANGTGIGRKAFLAEASNGFLRYLIKNGKSGTKMRPFDPKSKVAVANLTAAEIEHVIAFMRDKAW